MQSAEALHAEKCKLNETAQRALRAARCDLEKRIHEHDTCVAEGRAPNLIGVTLQMIKEQEAVVEAATATAKVRTSFFGLRKYHRFLPSRGRLLPQVYTARHLVIIFLHS